MTAMLCQQFGQEKRNNQLLQWHHLLTAAQSTEVRSKALLQVAYTAYIIPTHVVAVGKQYSLAPGIIFF